MISLFVLHFFEFGPDFPTTTELHHHVDVSCVFESSMKSRNSESRKHFQVLCAQPMDLKHCSPHIFDT